MADVQLTVVDNGDTQVVAVGGENPAVVLTAGSPPAVVTSSPGPQGPPGPAVVVAATAPITYSSGTQTVSTSMATNRLLGRTTSGTGTAEEISIGTGLSLASGTLSNTGLATPGGVNTYVQFNDGGTLGGDVDLTWNKTTNVLSVGGDVNLTDGGTFTTTLQTVTPTANRTVSIPNATGTLALVAGSSGQLLYNNAGANAGVSTMTFDGTSVTLAGRLINSYTSLASSPAKVFTGTWFTGGTATTTKPHFLIEPAGATSTAWSTSGTGFGVNAASGFAGNLLDLQVNGTSVTRITSGGIAVIAGGSRSAPGLQFSGATAHGIWNDSTTFRFSSNSVDWLQIRSNDINVPSASGYNIGGDVTLTRSAANVFKVTNGSSGDGTISAQHRLAGIAPATASSTGTAGDIRYDTGFIYVCTATNTWKRAALTTW